jgi:hypothetical protein
MVVGDASIWWFKRHESVKEEIARRFLWVEIGRARSEIEVVGIC